MTDENRLKHKAAKENLEEAYNLVKGEMLASKLKKGGKCTHQLQTSVV